MITTSGKLLGFVQVRVASRTYAVPVESMVFAPGRGDGEAETPRGGFFAEGDQMGIVVDESRPDVPEQIRRATEDAVRHLTLKFLN